MTYGKFILKDNLKIIQEKGLKLRGDGLDMRDVPSLVRR